MPRRAMPTILAALCTLVLTSTQLLADQADDEKAIKNIQARWDDAWNRHDARAFSLIFSLDADFTNWRGQHVHRTSGDRSKNASHVLGPNVQGHDLFRKGANDRIAQTGYWDC